MFGIGLRIDSDDLISWYFNKIIATQDIVKYCDDFFIYYNKKGFPDDFLKELCNNFSDLNIDKLIKLMSESGYDLCERLLKIFKSKNISTNEIIIRLSEHEKSYIQLMQYLDFKTISLHGIFKTIHIIFAYVYIPDEWDQETIKIIDSFLISQMESRIKSFNLEPSFFNTKTPTMMQIVNFIKQKY